MLRKLDRMASVTAPNFSEAIDRFFTTNKFSEDIFLVTCQHLKRIYSTKKFRATTSFNPLNHTRNHINTIVFLVNITTEKGKRISLNLSVESFFRDT